MDAFPSPEAGPSADISPWSDITYGDAGTARLPALIAAAGERAGVRFLEFFAAQIRNPHTRRGSVSS